MVRLLRLSFTTWLVSVLNNVTEIEANPAEQPAAVVAVPSDIVGRALVAS
jgi:hypothetical protein